MVRIFSRVKHRLQARSSSLPEALLAHEYARLSQTSGEVPSAVTVHAAAENWLQRCWHSCKQRMHRE
ncbi:hypothetical protein [Aquitalea sp. LB_tupeE]|uniref:hypothetical protein n=1 Tax=Aquitalea sp. LB_tupeE TaxID=2748078 RepID=UPI0015BD065B|nr:hypothetical protein [Aquitalea sp. LB_tupeE]NWK77794.1 hypothetical protein [Aquitalea sp. LB_tupeE]